MKHYAILLFDLEEYHFSGRRGKRLDLLSGRTHQWFGIQVIALLDISEMIVLKPTDRG